MCLIEPRISAGVPKVSNVHGGEANAVGAGHGARGVLAALHVVRDFLSHAWLAHLQVVRELGLPPPSPPLPTYRP